MATGEPCNEGTSMPSDTPTTAPPVESLMKCMPPNTRAMATKEASAPPTPMTIQGAVDDGTGPSRGERHDGGGRRSCEGGLGHDGGVVEPREEAFVGEEQRHSPGAHGDQAIVRGVLPRGAPVACRAPIDEVETAGITERRAVGLLRAHEARAQEDEAHPEDGQIDLGVQLKGRV